jgi:hypothetical protein
MTAEVTAAKAAPAPAVPGPETAVAATTTATKPAPPVSAPGVASAPIPFRKTSVTSGPEVFGTLVITLLVLAALSALAWYAQRRGWLDRWITQVPSKATGKRKLAVVEVLHVSRKTTLYRVSDGERELLLTESSVHAQLVPHAPEGLNS